MELQGRLDQLRRRGLTIVAVSYDSVEILRDFSNRRQISFPLLSDRGSAVIKHYGILNTTVDSASSQYGIPFPGTFMLDADGRVTSRSFETAYQERDTVSSVLAKSGARANSPGARVATPHLTLTTYLTDQTVAPGTHFSIVLDVVPGKRVHVYAPGVAGYKPIALALTSQPLLIVRDVQFPKSEDYFFKPLNEHVAVYQKPFRIVQDVMFDASRQSEAALRNVTSATIEGTLSYQACDDKVCFTPKSVPLSWTVALRPLDRERVQQ